MKQLTLTFLLTDDQICLAYKKRGFGMGKWNGYGGKVESGESLTEAACREIREESEVMVPESALELVAQHEFVYEEMDVHHVTVFVVRDWEGDPIETEEMRPQWYAFHEIPYSDMWEDDQHWLPRVLAGEKLAGVVHFNPDGHTIASMDWQRWRRGEENS